MGLDLPAQLGDPVRAAADGVMVKVDPQIGPLKYWTKDKKGQPVQRFLMQPKRNKAGTPVYDRNGHPALEHVIGPVGYGNRVWIDHPDGTQTTYNHLQSRSPLALGTKGEGRSNDRQCRRDRQCCGLWKPSPFRGQALGSQIAVLGSD